MARRLRLSTVAAALFALPAACLDKAGEDPTAAPNPAEATVFVQDYWGRGVQGLWVAAHDSAGNLAGEKQTGGSGAAHLALAGTNGSVTLYLARDEMLIVETVLHAGAGPVRFIVSPLDPPPAGFPAPTQFQVTTAVPPGTAWLTGDIGCFAAIGDGPPVGGAIRVDLTDEPCTQLATESIFLSARSTSGGELAWGLLGGVTEDPGATVALSASALQTSYLDWTVSARFSEPPTTAEGHVTGMFTTDYVGQRVGAVIATSSSGALHSFTSRLPDAPFVAFASSIGASSGTTNFYAFSAATTGGDPAFDFTGLPGVTVTALDASVDAARPVIAWTPPVSLDANVGVAGAYWMRSSGASTNFLVSFPTDVPRSQVRVPEMPARYSAWIEGDAAAAHVTFVEYRRSSSIHTPADIAADYYRGMDGMTPELPITFVAAQSLAP